MKKSAESGTRPTLVEIPEKLERGRCYDVAIGVGDSIEPPVVVQYADEYRLHQIVQSSGHDYDLEMLTSELMLTRPDLFVDCPLAAILDPACANNARETELRTFNREFITAKDKKPLLHEVRDHIFSLSNSESLTEDICLAADELLTNAIYNAPHVNFQKNGPGAPRTSTFGEANDLRPGSLFIGHNDKRVILGCSDAYGTLNPKALLAKLKSCYENGAADSVNFGTGGAGLGTFMMFQSALSLYLGVSPYRKTVICWAYSLERRARVRSALPKNIHVCTDSDSSAQ